MKGFSVEHEIGVLLSSSGRRGFRMCEAIQDEEDQFDGELIRKPRRHITKEKIAFGDRKRTRRSLQKYPPWIFRAGEDLDGRSDAIEDLSIEPQKPDRAWLWDANSLRVVYLPLDLGNKIL